MTVRLPLAPVMELVAPIDDALLAERLGVTRRSVVRWRRDGLTPPRADEVATRLGRHPRDLWGALYDWAEDCWEAEQHWPKGTPRPSFAGLFWIEPPGRFCGRSLHEPICRPHTCATDGCDCTRGT